MTNSNVVRKEAIPSRYHRPAVAIAGAPTALVVSERSKESIKPAPKLETPLRPEPLSRLTEDVAMDTQGTGGAGGEPDMNPTLDPVVPAHPQDPEQRRGMR